MLQQLLPGRQLWVSHIMTEDRKPDEAVNADRLEHDSQAGEVSAGGDSSQKEPEIAGADATDACGADCGACGGGCSSDVSGGAEGEDSSSDDGDSESADGQAPSLLCVRYGRMGQLGLFRSKLGRLPYHSRVVIKSDRGLEIGTVLCPGNKQMTYEDRTLRVLGVARRVATHEDLMEDRHLQQSAMRERKFCEERIRSRKLPMKLAEVEHLFGGDRIIFYFLSDGRVDFRELVRDLAQEYQTRIEMRQIGVRDEARLMADYERCGQYICCRAFIKEFKPVTMRMAKVQKATLDPSKISGRCGRLMCCLRFENETYNDLKERLPRRNSYVRTADGIGKVISTDIMTQLVKVAMLDKVHVVPVEELLERNVSEAAYQAEQQEIIESRRQRFSGRAQRSGSNRSQRSAGSGSAATSGGEATAAASSSGSSSSSPAAAAAVAEAPLLVEEESAAAESDVADSQDTSAGNSAAAGSDKSAGTESASRRRRQRRKRRKQAQASATTAGSSSEGATGSEAGNAGDDSHHPGRKSRRDRERHSRHQSQQQQQRQSGDGEKDSRPSGESGRGSNDLSVPRAVLESYGADFSDSGGGSGNSNAGESNRGGSGQSASGDDNKSGNSKKRRRRRRKPRKSGGDGEATGR